MSVELLNSSLHGEKAKNALAELRACHGELQAFVEGEFDRLGAMADEIVARRTNHDDTSRQTDREMMREQIDQLARVAADVAELVAEQKRFMSRRGRD